MTDSTKPNIASEKTEKTNPYQANASPVESIQIARRRTMRKSATLGAMACSSAPLLAYGGTRIYEFLNGARPWTDLPNQLVILGALTALFGIAGALIGAAIRLVGYLLLPDR